MNSSSSDYLTVKRRKLFMLNVATKSSSEYLENKQFRILQTSITKDFKPMQRFSIVLPNEPLTCCLIDEVDESENEVCERKPEMNEKEIDVDENPPFDYNPYVQQYPYPDFYNTEANQHILSNPTILSLKEVVYDFISGKHDELSKTLTEEKRMAISTTISKLYSKSKNIVSQQMILIFFENFNTIVNYFQKSFKNKKDRLGELTVIISIMKEKHIFLDYLTNSYPPHFFHVKDTP